MRILKNQLYTDVPNELDYELASRAVGCKTEEIPIFEHLEQLLAWAALRAGLGGNQYAMAAVLDRIAPKPRRLEIDGHLDVARAPMAAGAGVGDEEAARYYERLGSENPDDDLDD